MTTPEQEPAYTFRITYANYTNATLNNIRIQLPPQAIVRMDVRLTAEQAEELFRSTRQSNLSATETLQEAICISVHSGLTMITGSDLAEEVLPNVAATYSKDQNEDWEPIPLEDIPLEVCWQVLLHLQNTQSQIYDGYQFHWPDDLDGSGVEMEQILRRAG